MLKKFFESKVRLSSFYDIITCVVFLQEVFMAFTTPPEIFTSLSDLLCAVAATAFFFVLLRDKSTVARLWKVVMCSLAVSSCIGFTVHLLDWDEAFERIVWVILPVFMCIACSMFSVAAVSDASPRHTKTALVVFSSMCALSYAGLLALYFAYGGSKFLVVYTFYAIVCVLFSAAVFGYSFIKTKRKSYLLYLLGILAEVPGGIVQAKRDLYFTLIWKMDYNTVYHMILLTTIILFMAGYLQSRKEKSAENN